MIQQTSVYETYENHTAPRRRSEVVPVHAMKAYVEREEKLHSFLTLAADGDKWLAVPTVTVSPLRRAGAHSWSVHSCSCLESNHNPYSVQPVV